MINNPRRWFKGWIAFDTQPNFDCKALVKCIVVRVGWLAMPLLSSNGDWDSWAFDVIGWGLERVMLWN